MSDSDSAKQYNLSISHRDGYLYFYVEGDHDSCEISLAYWREIAGEAARTGVKRLLIDENIPESVSMAEMFRFASEIPQMGFGNARIAFVDRHLEQNELNQFGELVAVNRGVNVKIFNAVEDAEVWLLTDH